MSTTLRDYQSAAVASVRKMLFTEKKRAVVLQLPTGGGKTAIVSEISKSIQDKGKRVWFIVPRKELVAQSKAHFVKWGIKFGVIDAKNSESRAYKAHIISLQTLMRRLDKIKEFPDIAIFDECHLNYDAQLKIMRYLECCGCGMVFQPQLSSGMRMCADKAEPCQKVKACGRWSV